MSVTMMLTTTTMVSTCMLLTMMMVVMIALYIWIESESSCNKLLYCCICISRNTTI